MKITIKFDSKEKLQRFFEDAQDLFDEHGVTLSPDKEGSEAMKEVTEVIK